MTSGRPRGRRAALGGGPDRVAVSGDGTAGGASGEVRRGVVATLPVALGVVPFGVAYGTVAGQRMGWAQAQLMSLTVFAGTVQFVVASMLAEGAPSFRSW